MRPETKAFFLSLLFLLTGIGFHAVAQDCTFNPLCIHNGGEYWVTGNDLTHDDPEVGGGKYFPSFAHWAGQGTGDPLSWPWKIRGWSWMGVQVKEPFSNTWIWQTCLQKSKDLPYASTMTWPYPLNYALGVVSPVEAPSPLLVDTVPVGAGSPIPGNLLLYPSSAGGFDAYLNLFATAEYTETIPSTQPFYGYEFGFILAPAASAFEVPSGYSVYEYVWENKGTAAQYLVLSGNETDSSGNAGGNKGKSYSVGGLGGADFYYFTNDGTGSMEEWAMCLLLEDVVAIPVNTTGASNSANPFAAYGFDTGVATLTPVVTSGDGALQIMTLDFANPGTGRILLAGHPWNGPAQPYGGAGYRLPFAWDFYTSFFLSITPFWFHSMMSGYPACSFGTTAGGHSPARPIPADPILYSIELRCCSFSAQGRAPSASYMITFF
jgi:hypothetical protein